ncbi:MAG TPA: allantoicase [Vicinamibacterales bacterium]|jgi:allantoicase
MTPPYADLVDLAAERFGGAVIDANDEFFAAKENLIKREPAAWHEGEYTDRGKWMDGWETRRRRDIATVGSGAHDWCIVRLGARGIVRGVDVETTFFTGNYPEACAIDMCDLPALATLGELEVAAWRELLEKTALKGDSHNAIGIAAAAPATHLRLRIYPDGGVARLRVYGDVVADWNRLRQRGEVDLAAAEHGGVVVGCSDMFFGSRHNLIMPGDAINMGDGWETKRRRGPGHDWTIVRLAARGIVRRAEIDTRHYKGNAPGECSLDACVAATDDDTLVVDSSIDDNGRWRELLARTTVQPHARQIFDRLHDIGSATHVRFNIFPDGGVGRLRLFGTPE